MGPNGPGKARAAAQPAKARTATWGVAVAAVFALIVLLNLTHFMRSNAHVSGAVRLNDGGQAAGEEQLDPKAALSRAWRAGAARLHAPQLQGFGADRARAAHDVHGAPVVSSEQEVTSVDYIRRFALTAPELVSVASWLAAGWLFHRQSGRCAACRIAVKVNMHTPACAMLQLPARGWARHACGRHPPCGPSAQIGPQRHAACWHAGRWSDLRAHASCTRSGRQRHGGGACAQRSIYTHMCPLPFSAILLLIRTARRTEITGWPGLHPRTKPWQTSG